MVAVALTSHAQVGVDLEYLEIQSDLLELAKRILSEEDHQKFQALPHGDLPAAFFRTWTRKEAYLKARGEGIAEGLQQISVAFGPEEITSIKDARDGSVAGNWRLINLPVPVNYMGCVACDDAEKRIECNLIHFEHGEIIEDSLSSLG